MNRLSLVGSIIAAALVISPAVEYQSGLLVFVVVLLLAVAAANLVAILDRR